MKFFPFIRQTLACAVLFAACPAGVRGEQPKAAPGTGSDARARPSLREIWVPTDDLAPILGRYPRAVSLDRDQLFSLLRDAHVDDSTNPDSGNQPPMQAVVRLARFEGWPTVGSNGKTQVRVEGQLEIEVFTDAWAEVPLGLQGIPLGTFEDGAPASRASDAAGLRRTGGGTDGSASVEIKGRGVHRVRLGFVLPVKTESDGSSLALPSLTGVGEFILHLPAGTRADSPTGCAVQSEAGGIVARVALRRAVPGPVISPTAIRDFAKPDRSSSRSITPAEPERLHWRTPPPPSTETGALLQSGRTEATVGESGMTLRQEIRLRAALGQLTGEARLALPTGASAVRVDGPALGRWEIGADGLHVELVPDGASDGTAVFSVVYDLALKFDAKGSVHRELPVLEAAGAHRVVGELVVKRSQGITVQRIEPGEAVAPAATGTFPRAQENAPDFVSGFVLTDLPAAGSASPLAALQLTARRNTTRFSVDADARADFQPDGVRIARTLAIQVDEGELFVARVVLPAGETVLTLHAADHGREPDWHQEGNELRLNWTTGLPESSKTVLAIDSRAEFTAPKLGAPVDFPLGAALVSGAERLTGYVALASAPAFRLVTTGGEERLERRDGRTTPVRGDVAWFYRDDFRLALRVERRAAEIEARFTGYALPLAGVVEIHAQIDYRFLHSGLESVKVRVPRESADAFYFTGEHIAERRRDDDVWTIRFQGEQSGSYTLGVQATLPSPADRDNAQRFHFRLPTIMPLETAHWSGAWAVEANTDTEIRFAAKGANEVDALHAPPLAGYQPKRRVIGAFEFLGGTPDMAIDLDGVRHAAAASAVAVVDALDLTTAISTSGVMRHRATVRARNAADGFFDLHLPAGAALWSLTVNGAPVKPVSGAGAADELRVELPGGQTPAKASRIVILYETPGQPWRGSGWRSVVAPQFGDGVPVLHSHWTLSVPDGYEYRFDEMPTGDSSPNPTSGDLLIPRMATAIGHLAQWVYYHPWSHNESGLRRLPRWMAETHERSAGGSSGVASVDLDMADSMAAPDEVAALDLPATQAMATPAVPNASADVTARHIARVEPIKKFLLEAQQFYDTGRFDLAFKRYEQVLALDPYNEAARRGEERVDLARTKRGDAQTYQETRGRLTAQSASDWEAPVRRSTQKINENSGTVAIQRKLQTIVIPNIEFRQTTLNDAVEFLRQEARRLDTASPEEERGVNIFLKLTATPANAAEPGIPGLPPATVPTGTTRISLTLSNIPLGAALDYVAKAANLKTKIEPYAVSLVPLTEETGDMITVEIRIPQDLLGISPNQAPTPNDVSGVGTVNVARTDAKHFLESSGVTFPPGSSAVYLPATQKLIVRNTQANVDLVTALASTSGAPRSQAPLPAINGRESAKGVPGLLPLRLDLPANGAQYEFDGGEMRALSFHYADWAVAARWRWVFLTLGTLAFLVGAAGSEHPWRRTLYAGLALTFFPLVVAPSATTPCNALFAGWLWAAACWCVTRLLLRRRRLAAAIPLVCWVMLFPSSRSMAAPAPSPAPSPEVVIVPYDGTKPVAHQVPTQYYLPYERFLLLWDAAKHHRRPSTPEPPPGGERFLFGAARYDARLNGGTLEVDASLDFQTFGEGWVGIPLRFEANRIVNVTLDDAPAALGMDGLLWVGTPGGHRVKVFLRLPAPSVGPGTRLSWAVPSTAATLVTVNVPRADLRVEVHGTTPEVGEIEETIPEGSRLTASLGNATTVELAFRDVPAPAPAAGQPALASVDAHLTASARQESVAAEIRFSFPGRTQDHFTVLLDHGLTLTGLDGPEIRQWHLAASGERQTLEVALGVPARDGYRLALTADRPIGSLPAEKRRFPAITALATRVEQTAALLTEGAVEISLPDGAPSGMRRTSVPVPDQGRLWAAFSGDGNAAVVYSVRAAVEKRTARINSLYQVGREKIELAASVHLSPGPGRSLVTADLRLPAGFTVQAVVGEAIAQWWRDGDNLSLRFHPGAGQSEVSLLVYLVRQFERAPERFTLAGLTAVGFTATEGETVVAADGSFKVGLALPDKVRSDQLSEIKAATAAPEFVVKAPLERQRAFRYRGTGFDVAVTLEIQPARWQTQWVTQATVRDGTVALETHVNTTMSQGAMDFLEFSVPSDLSEARVSGADVRETVMSNNSGGRRTYRVYFQNSLYVGTESGFTVNLELPLDANNQAALPDFTFAGEGSRAASGFILVENASSGEMTLDPHGLEPAIEKDVPFLPPLIVAGTRFYRAAPGTPWSLGIRVTNLEKTAGRAALVAYAELTTTLRANGEEWHRATYRLQNRRLQFLPVQLPPGMELVGARVAGESVRVDAGPAGSGEPPLLLVPLVRTRPGEMSYDVELIYRRAGSRSGPRKYRFRIRSLANG